MFYCVHVTCPGSSAVIGTYRKRADATQKAQEYKAWAYENARLLYGPDAEPGYESVTVIQSRIDKGPFNA